MGIIDSIRVVERIFRRVGIQQGRALLQHLCKEGESTAHFLADYSLDFHLGRKKPS